MRANMTPMHSASINRPARDCERTRKGPAKQPLKYGFGVPKPGGGDAIQKVQQGKRERERE